ncbi:unnamed protein product [Paramecium pentaurelia]|uniref:Uncharacterized protein n=1 Tax=Paramecium pentaurelia TaxID=43138 RepID=A0A8S1XH89_9CILI|nr:unnamed protein product [Paramecium pentaurelia]
MPYGPLLYPNQPNIQIDLDLPDQVIQNQQNIGYGIWTKYQPFADILDLRNRESQINVTINRSIISEGGQFIYSMKQKENGIQILVVSIVIDYIEQSFQYNIYYSFTQTTNVIQFNISSSLIEGLWIMVYVYYDQLSQKTTFGLYNSMEPLKIHLIHDVPTFQGKIRHNIGGIYAYQNLNGVLVQLSQFFGMMSNLFTSDNQNILFDLDQCVDEFLNYDTCQIEEYRVSEKNQKMNGQDFIRITTSPLNKPIYLIQGWIKLDLQNVNMLETIIFRISINYNYNDDIYIGDRDVLLKYFQSSIPGENGFEISTYSYTFPVKTRYNTEDDDKISEYGDQYSTLFVIWHYFQYEIGTLNNNGQPLFTLYFPSINQYQKYVWNKPIKHFTGVTYFLFIGGDNYAKSFFQGYFSDILFILYCNPFATSIVMNCDYSCLECDGPTSINCLSCHENSHRLFSRTGKTCNCEEGYVDINGQQECLSVNQMFPYLTKQEIQLDCNMEGYSRCDGLNVECKFGYFLFLNQCIQCPEFSQFISGIHISCFDCYTQPLTFGQSLTCTQDAQTYYSNSKYSYQVVQRDNKNLSYYEMIIQDDATYVTKLCIGCIGYQLCKEGYYFNVDQCKPCIKDCFFCENSYSCGICYDDCYLGKENQCLKCPNCKRCFTHNDFLWCSHCQDNQILQNNECVSCGINCDSCDSKGYCNFCIGDPSKYYLSIDGRNCIECNIENCRYCFQYVIISGQYYTTLDINFNIYNFNSNQVNFGCALCNQNYNYNQSTQKCELKLNNNNCEFAVILDSTSKQQCIISLKNNDAVQVTSCSSLNNCQQCIHHYIANESYCIQCDDGYYSGLLTGQCQLCINNCKTCIQQNSSYKDYWKWNTKAFYKAVINFNNDKSFEDYRQSNSQSDLEVICTSCQLSYILFEQKCIKGCEENCNNCEIINGQATCIQCQETDFGFLKSKNTNGTCIQCPSNCIACVERNQKEITDINPYYILTNENLRYTRKCYEKSKKQDNYYVDFLTQTITVCTSNTQCYHKYIIEQNIYCDISQYLQFRSDSHDDLFEQKNILISQFYDYEYLNLFETKMLYDYLNEAQVRHAEFQFTLVQGNEPECYIEENLNIYSLLQQNIFTLQQIDIIIQGQTNPTIVTFYNELTLSNFTKITFKNIKFNFIQGSNNGFFITLFNLKLQLILNLENIIFTMPYNEYRNISLMIRTNIPYSLLIENLTIINFFVSSSDIFTFMSIENSKKNNIQINNLKILDSNFFNSTLFRYQAKMNILLFDTFFNQTSIQDTIFSQSNFIHSYGLLNYTTGNLWIKQIMLLNVQILQNSSILLLCCFQQSLISNLTLFNSRITQHSNFYSSNVINLKHGIINNTYIMNSNLINNQVEYSKYESALESSSKAFIENYLILNTLYDDKQQIIKIIKYNEIDQLSFRLVDFSIMNSLLTSQIQQQEISYSSSIIYCECQLCYLESINLLRGHGLPEMTFLYSEFINISNCSISSNLIYQTKPLHNSLDCIKKFAFKDMHFFLYIGFYQTVNINNLHLQNSLSFNNPFIILQGYDLMQRLISEVITIINVKFYSNLLLITDSNKQTGLLSIISQQNCSITLLMLNYTENHLNEYYQDSSRISATTAFIQLYQGWVLIQASHFVQNIITNSSDSILYIKSAKLEIRECTFTKNNVINYSSLSHYLLYSEVQDLSSIKFQDLFPIKALSGNGMIIAQSIIIDKIFINQSYATAGGGFHIVTQGKSSILIINSHFSNTNTLSHVSIFSIGGCLYIDGSASQLQFILRNTTIEKSYSRNDGGAIYIIPSESQNSIVLEQLIIINCFSLQNSIFSYKTIKLESIDTQIKIQNINFYSTELGFNRFIQQINGLTENEAYNIAHQNPQIFIQNGFITILNCSFMSTQFQFLIQIKQAYNIYLSNVTIQNSTYYQSPLIELNLKEKFFGKIIIQNLYLLNIDQFKKPIKEGECQEIESVKSSVLECPLSLPTKSWSAQIIDNIHLIKNQLLCNQFLIFQDQPFNFSLITIKQIDNAHQVIVNDLFMQDVNCNNCIYGLFQIVDIQISKSESLQFQSIIIQNCICGLIGCLSILKNQDDLLFHNELFQSDRLLQYKKLDDINFNLDYLTIISNCIFSNNSAHFGGSLFIQEIDVFIKNSQFYNNFAQIGGAIYFFSKQKQLYFFRTKFFNNRASIAGAVFFNNQSLQLTKELEIEFADNNSTQYEQNIFEKPRSLTISIDGGKTLLEKKFIKKNKDEIIEQIRIIPYKILGYQSKVNQLTLPSGRSIQSYQYFDEYTYSFIPYNLTFRIIALDKFNNQNKGLYDSSCTLKPMAFNLTSQSEATYVTYSLSKYHAFFDNNTGDYNLDDLVIYWNPNYDQDLVLRISIECNEISVPFYNKDPPYVIQSQNNNYKLLVDIRTFQCQLGEFLNQTTGGCMICDKFQNQYQVTRKALNCSYKDDTKIRLIESSMIELRQYYWRAYNYSQNIEYCYHFPKNCQGGWKPGDKSCIVGHIGALCEQCDLYNTRGQGSFYLSSAYQCLNCNITIYNILSITFVILWTLLSTLISVSSTSEMVTEFIAGLRLRLFGVKFPIKQISTAILIKVLTNYLQIISTLFTFQLELPPGLSAIINSCANPIESMAFSLDCYLVSITDILIIYFRVIWSLIMALSYILIFIGLGALAIALKIIHHDFSFITISLIYLFIYFQPNLIGQLISLLSYRKISDEFWISSNVSYRYDTSSHLKWIIAFDIPLLIILCITIPTILWYGVYKNRQKLDKTTTRKTWGYLYHEYIKKAYFWETIKIIQKELIILSRIYYDDQITIKASLIFLLLFSYSHFAKSINPYMTKQLNILDQQSIIICAISIVLACSIHSAQQQNLNEITWPFYVIIGGLNSYYITKLIVSIILAYFKRIFDKIDCIKQKLFTYLPLKLRSKPKIQKIFETSQSKFTRIQKRFRILKEYLLSLARENLKVRKFKQEQQQQRENSHQLHQMILQYSLKGRSLKYSDHNRRQSQFSTFGNHSRICSRPDEEQENQFWRIQTQRQESQIL